MTLSGVILAIIAWGIIGAIIAIPLGRMAGEAERMRREREEQEDNDSF